MYPSLLSTLLGLMVYKMYYATAFISCWSLGLGVFLHEILELGQRHHPVLMPTVAMTTNTRVTAMVTVPMMATTIAT